MAVTVTIDGGQEGRYVQGDRFVRAGLISLGTSYATNGVPVSKANFELPVSLTSLDIDNAGGYCFEWDKVNAKIKAYRQKDPAAAGGADIPLPEVANATDLSTISSRFRAVGK